MSSGIFRHLSASPGESIEQPPLALAVVLLQPALDDVDYHLIGNQFTLQTKHTASAINNVSNRRGCTF